MENYKINEKKLINFIFSVSQIIFLTVVTTGAVFLEVYSEKKDSWRIFICYIIGAMILEWQICQYRKEALGKKQIVYGDIGLEMRF